jgi:lipopolysaccharide/colanic/teichoic acid biosynthesis glycosyltransferase
MYKMNKNTEPQSHKLKRIFDFTFALLGIVFLFSLFLIISLIILITMPGPILFRQQRVGQFGRVFLFNKFRSMRVFKEASRGSFDAGNSSRITPLGHFLRKTKLDELPQLFNVLKGDMSIVGPRPEVKYWTEVYPEKWKIVHSVRPGITDNASILFRNEEEILAKSSNPTETYRNEILPRKLDLYIEYVNNRSFLGDIKVIFKTIKAVVVGCG